jgi:hypothetical protein
MTRRSKKERPTLEPASDAVKVAMERLERSTDRLEGLLQYLQTRQAEEKGNGAA